MDYKDLSQADALSSLFFWFSCSKAATYKRGAGAFRRNTSRMLPLAPKTQHQIHHVRLQVFKRAGGGSFQKGRVLKSAVTLENTIYLGVYKDAKPGRKHGQIKGRGG